jgi:hypothetical protein
VDPLLPAELGAALRVAGYRPAGPLGLGGTGPRWSAVDGTGYRWAVTTVPAAAVPQLEDRVARLATVEHPGVARVGPVVPMPDGRAIALVEAVAGVDLAALTSARGQLTGPEVAGVLTAVAGALDRLHSAGVVHGDVSPANLVRGERGTVLVDLVSGAWAREAGTRGFASSTRRAAASAPDDVHALGRVGLALLGGDRGGERDEESGAVVALCRAASADAPADRPEAREVAAVAATLTQEAVRLPTADVLTQMALRSVAATRAPVTRPSRGRYRRPGRRLVPALGLGVCAIVASVVVATFVGAPVDGSQPLDGPAPRSAAPDGAGARACELTLRRAAALATGDQPALQSVTAPGSPAAIADLRLLAGGVGRAEAGVADVRVQVAQRGPARTTGPFVRVRVATRTTEAGRRGPWRGVELVLDRASARVVRVGEG